MTTNFQRKSEYKGKHYKITAKETGSKMNDSTLNGRL
jgi:hypothetical protein